MYEKACHYKALLGNTDEINSSDMVLSVDPRLAVNDLEFYCFVTQYIAVDVPVRYITVLNAS